MRDSNRTSNGGKPSGKHLSSRFPLYLHKTGQYAKRVRGRVVYFGRNREEALRRWLNEKDSLKAGLVVREQPKPAHVTLKTVCDALLAQKRSLVSSGELSPRTLADYQTAVKHLIGYFGPYRFLIDLRPVDFIPFRQKCAANRSAVRTSNILRFVRSTLKFAYDQDLIDRPLKFAKALALPSQAVIRAEQHKRGPLMFSASEIRIMLDGTTITNESRNAVHRAGASPALRAMILLAINCGFGNTDCSRITLQSINLKTGWHNFPRPKTAVERRCPLWQITIDAIEAYLTVRPEPRNASLADRLFLTRFGDEFVKVRETSHSDGTRITPIDAIGLTSGQSHVVIANWSNDCVGMAFVKGRGIFRSG